MNRKEITMSFHSTVVAGAISRCAQYLIQGRLLTGVARVPHGRVGLLGRPDFLGLLGDHLHALLGVVAPRAEGLPQTDGQVVADGLRIQSGSTANTLQRLVDESSQGGCLQGAAAHPPLLRVGPMEQGLLCVGQHALQEPNQRLLQLVLHIVVGVDGEPPLDHKVGVLRPLVHLGGSVPLGDQEMDSLTSSWCCRRVPLSHLLGHRDVGSIRLVVRGRPPLGQLLGQHQFRHLDAALLKVPDDLPHVLAGGVQRLVDEKQVEDALLHTSQQPAKIPSDKLNPFGLELIVLVGPRPGQRGVALFVHQQVWKVDLLKLHLDGLHKMLRNLVRRLLPQAHGLRYGLRLKIHHHTVRVAVQNDSVGMVAAL
mmetsp:Transcript_69952/g.186383  ORF Transcript_69952/g.186383 Transcript_69952/m.186383 type:complete len:367 (+) Transcript_69952:50-1150(+)